VNPATFFSSFLSHRPSVHLFAPVLPGFFFRGLSSFLFFPPPAKQGSFFFRRFLLLLPRAVSVFFAGFFFPWRQLDARTLSAAEALPLLQGPFSSKPAPEGSPSRLLEI
jgi:hypothetical protein